MISCRHYFFNDRSDQEHFLLSKSVPASKIAWGAARTNIASDVRLCVVDSIQSPRGIGRPAIGAWLTNNRQDFGGRHIALVNSPVRLPKIDGSAFLSSLVGVLTRGFPNFLFGRWISPSLVTLLAHRASSVVTRLAFIRESKRARRILNEMFNGGGFRLFASLTYPLSGRCASVCSRHTALCA